MPRTVTIAFDGLASADCRTNHHNEEGEWAIAVPVQPVKSITDLKDAFMAALNACAREADFPWGAIEADFPRFLELEEQNLNAYQQDYRDCLANEGDKSMWWFVITEELDE